MGDDQAEDPPERGGLPHLRVGRALTPMTDVSRCHESGRSAGCQSHREI